MQVANQLGVGLRQVLGNAAGFGGRDAMPGLLLHYTMQNVSGSVLVDEQGRFDGAMSSVGLVEVGAEFNGSNGHVSVSSFPAKPERFVLYADFTAHQVGDFDSILGTISGWGTMLFRFEAGVVKFYVWKDSEYLIIEHPVSVGVNYRVLLQVDGSKMEMYVNGARVGSLIDERPIVYKPDDYGLRLGGDYNLTAGRFFDGVIREFKAFDAMLSEDQAIVMTA